jgi:hypothetical protein
VHGHRKSAARSHNTYLSNHDDYKCQIIQQAWKLVVKEENFAEGSRWLGAGIKIANLS